VSHPERGSLTGNSKPGGFSYLTHNDTAPEGRAMREPSAAVSSCYGVYGSPLELEGLAISPTTTRHLKGASEEP